MEACTHTYKLSVYVYCLHREGKELRTICSRRVNGAKGPGRARFVHTQGGHSQLYAKSTVQNKLPVYFKFIVLKCKMCVCSPAAAERRSTAGWNNNNALSLAHCQPPVGVKCTHTATAAAAALQRSTFIPLNHPLSFSFVRALHRRAHWATFSTRLWPRAAARLANNFP